MKITHALAVILATSCTAVSADTSSISWASPGITHHVFDTGTLTAGRQAARFADTFDVTAIDASTAPDLGLANDPGTVMMLGAADTPLNDDIAVLRKATTRLPATQFAPKDGQVRNLMFLWMGKQAAAYNEQLFDNHNDSGTDFIQVDGRGTVMFHDWAIPGSDFDGNNAAATDINTIAPTPAAAAMIQAITADGRGTVMQQFGWSPESLAIDNGWSNASSYMNPQFIAAAEFFSANAYSAN